ncbi:MAG: cupin domain-containing protein, partial [Clostridia bacterium]|nr:cupin domain-containing protein [Clostridia bacterium]
MEKLNLTFGNYKCSMYVNENLPKKVTNYSVTRHCNVEYELFVVLLGSAAIDVEDTTYSLEAGDALLIAPTKFHCFIETSDDIVNFTFPFMMHDSTASKAFFRQVSP